MELLYIWVRDFKSLKNTGINFHSNYDVSYSEESNVLKIDSIDDSIPADFFGKNVGNLKAIIGENGSGKTLTLELIYGFLDNYYTPSIVVFGQKKEGKYQIRSYYHRSMKEPKKGGVVSPNVDVDEYKQHGAGSTNNALTTMLEENLRMIYLNYGMSVNPINSHSFGIDLTTHNLLENLQLPFLSDKVYGSPLKKFFLEEAIRYSNFLAHRKKRGLSVFSARISHIGIYFPFESGRRSGLYNRMFRKLFFIPSFKRELSIQFKKQQQRNVTSGWLNITKNSNLGKIILGMDMLLSHELIFDVTGIQTMDDLLAKIRREIKLELSQSCINLFDFFWNLKSTDLKTDIRATEYFTEIDRYIDAADVQFQLKVEVASEFFELYSKVALENKASSKYRYNFHYGLSSGELSMLSYFSRLHSVADKIKERNNVLLLIDECELHLHPTWQKKFLNYFLKFLQSEFPKQKFQIIIATHSPFIFSDIPLNCGIVLHRNKRDKLEVYKLKDNEQTMGANIHKLYTDRFLLEDSLIGDFAKEKILSIITTVNRAKKIDSYKCKRLLTEVNLIGERFIRKKILETMLKKAKDSSVGELVITEINKFNRRD